MLNDLRILNGSITPVFDSSIKDYEVEVSDTVISLVMEYDTDDSNHVTIYGNDNLSTGENHILIEVYDGNIVNTYTLTVYKGLSNTINEQNTFEKIEVSERVYDNSIIHGCIIIGTIIIIFMLYKIIFRKCK